MLNDLKETSLLCNLKFWKLETIELITMKTILGMCLMYNLKFRKFKIIESIITQKTLDICFMYNHVQWVNFSFRI
jgi:hypothetical protein